MGWVSALLLLAVIGEVWTCIKNGNKKRQSDLCRLELRPAVLYGKVVAIYKDPHRETHKDAPVMGVASKESYSVEVELLCDIVPEWSMHYLKLIGGFRPHYYLTGLGDFDCHSYTIMENNTYFFVGRKGSDPAWLFANDTAVVPRQKPEFHLNYRYDKNRNMVPDGINGQDSIFPDTPENKKMFFSHFKFSDCVSGTIHETYSPGWEPQENSVTFCTSVQKALYEEEDRVQMLNQKVKSLEKSINHLRETVKGYKRSLRRVNKERAKLNAKQDTGKSILKPVKKPVNHNL